tara:strand:- start:1551 stop:1826 length:276 start_codon:yes stop_codon:yes gene_type:complete
MSSNNEVILKITNDFEEAIDAALKDYYNILEIQLKSPENTTSTISEDQSEGMSEESSSKQGVKNIIKERQRDGLLNSLREQETYNDLLKNI